MGYFKNIAIEQMKAEEHQDPEQLDALNNHGQILPDEEHQPTMTIHEILDSMWRAGLVREYYALRYYRDVASKNIQLIHDLSIPMSDLDKAFYCIQD